MATSSCEKRCLDVDGGPPSGRASFGVVVMVSPSWSSATALSGTEQKKKTLEGTKLKHYNIRVRESRWGE
jgi:hypothetical protein